MSRWGCGSLAAICLGFVTGVLLCAVVLGAQLRRHEEGLWTVRFRRVLDCGLDYSGPPYTSGPVNVWLTCGEEDRSWKLWPAWGE